MDSDRTLRSMVRDDAYQVIDVLADGAGGRTELVRMEGEEGLLVRKRIPLELANASAWATLMGEREPLLPRIESLYQMPDELVVVYEYVPGTSLTQLVEQSGALSPTFVGNIMRDLCQAVGVLHGHGIVHRDITPNNVIVDEGLRAHLMDLGIARQWSDGRTKDTTTLGTWGFAAPEQYGFAQTDQRSDIYALGRLLGYVLTGRRPSDEGFDAALAELQARGSGLAAVAGRATTFEPSARYQDVGELRQAVDDALGRAEGVASGTTVNARPDTSPTPPPIPLVADETPHQTADTPQDEGTWVTAVLERLWIDVTPGPQTIRLRDARLPVFVATICAWGLLAAGILLVVLTTFDALTRHVPPWGPSQYAMSVVCCWGLCCMGVDAYCLATRRGIYTERRTPLGVIRRICKIVAVVFVLMVVAAVVLTSGSAE